MSPEGHLAADFETSFEVTGWTGEEGSGKGSKLKPDQLDAENVAEHVT